MVKDPTIEMVAVDANWVTVVKIPDSDSVTVVTTPASDSV